MNLKPDDHVYLITKRGDVYMKRISFITKKHYYCDNYINDKFDMSSYISKKRIHKHYMTYEQLKQNYPEVLI